jgi:AAA15 family ATPase/GTPase
MLGLMLALVNTRDRILLIVEIENGLHYLVLPSLWHVLVGTARRLNVQVIATSHSWDRIQAFQQVAEEDTESEGLLLRLEVRGDSVQAVLIDEDELAIATSGQIEVR